MAHISRADDEGGGDGGGDGGGVHLAGTIQFDHVLLVMERSTAIL